MEPDISGLRLRFAELLLPYRAIRRVKSRLQEVQQAADRLRAENQGLVQGKHALAQELASAQAHVVSLEQRQSELDATLSLQAIAGKDLDARNQALESELTDVTRRNQALELELATLTGRNQTLVRELTSATGRGQALERDLATLTDRSQTLECELTSATGRGQALEHELATLSGRSQALERELATLTGRNQSLEHEVSTLAAHDRNLQREVGSLAERNHALECEITMLAVGNRDLDAEILRLQGRSGQVRLVDAANELSANLSGVIHVAEDDIGLLDATPKLLLACMPKSGSTWLTSSLQQQLGLAPMRCYLEADRNEQEVDPLVFFQSMGRRALFVQQHIRYSRILLRLSRAFSTKIVVLSRRLDDIVVSLRDHMENESAEWSMFYMESDWFRDKSVDGQIDFLIDHAMPWYFNFLIGWQRAATLHPERILHVHYEEMLQDQQGCIARIASFYGGGAVPSLETPEVVQGGGTRFNVGRIGRGVEVLNPAQRARLARLASHYPECDLTRAGI